RDPRRARRELRLHAAGRDAAKCHRVRERTHQRRRNAARRRLAGRPRGARNRRRRPPARRPGVRILTARPYCAGTRAAAGWRRGEPRPSPDPRDFPTLNAIPEIAAPPPPFALPQPYLLFLGDVPNAANAKTAFGLRDWARDQCVGEYA